ncbi:MAG TPA: hypothetical protein VMT32_16835 [Bryobacteraceae bacterium]|nr:hypothetical protein [Bryobacteraceae bacterium]
MFLRGWVGICFLAFTLPTTGTPALGQSKSRRIEVTEARELMKQAIEKQNPDANIHVVTNPYDQPRWREPNSSRVEMA